MRFLSIAVLGVLVLSILVHDAIATAAAVAKGKHYAVQDHDAAQKAIDAQRRAKANHHANANLYNNAVNNGREQEASADREQSLGEKKRALADKENREHDSSKDILAKEDAGLYRKKRLSVIKKDVLDETRAWRKARLIGNERARDRQIRDINDANEDRNVGAAATDSDADSNSAAGSKKSQTHGGSGSINGGSNYVSYYV